MGGEGAGTIRSLHSFLPLGCLSLNPAQGISGWVLLIAKPKPLPSKIDPRKIKLPNLF
jgi:hypothetical protein